VIDIEAHIKAECSGYFQTPCNHCFHSVCLRKWTDTKLECPTCRQVLTPIGVYDGLDDDEAL